MKRIIMTLALVAAAAAAGATPPPVGRATVTIPPASSGSMTAPSTTPSASPPSASTVAPSTTNALALPNAPGSNDALKKIQADGYKNVQGLSRGADGNWHGKAMRGNTMVDVMVDSRGNVSAQ
jgi:hypothetical protein